MDSPFNIYETQTYDEKSYVLNSETEFLLIRNEKGDILGMQLRGCFAWYLPSIDRIFEICKYVNDNILSGNIDTFGNSFLFDNYDGYKKDILKNTKERYELFLKHFGNINRPVVASEFYKFINKKNNIIFKWKSKYPYKEKV